MYWRHDCVSCSVNMRYELDVLVRRIDGGWASGCGWVLGRRTSWRHFSCHIILLVGPSASAYQWLQSHTASDMFYLTFNLLRTIWVESVAQHITHTHTHTHNNIYIYIYIYICTHYVYSNTLRAPYARIVCFYYVHHAHLLSLSLSLSLQRGELSLAQQNVTIWQSLTGLSIALIIGPIKGWISVLSGASKLSPILSVDIKQQLSRRPR